jgi:hypothetical protein
VLFFLASVAAIISAMAAIVAYRYRPTWYFDGNFLFCLPTYRDPGFRTLLALDGS